jgi:hypothetical protein
MCQICGRLFCDALCPAFGGDSCTDGALYGACMQCNKRIYIADKAVRRSDGLLCEACAEPNHREMDVWQGILYKWT